jgi:hypothetical protein
MLPVKFGDRLPEKASLVGLNSRGLVTGCNRHRNVGSGAPLWVLFLD